MRPLIVAIDGPSGAGKSTVARAVARALGLPYLDTGAMYRAVGLAARRAGVDLPIENPAQAARIAGEAVIGLSASPDDTIVTLGDEDVSRAIREPEISLYASAVSAIPEVRRILVARQREIGATTGGVLEGRDIGTRVFPDTPHKFFLTAGEAERARRRYEELRARGSGDSYEKVLAEMRRRDRDDSSRSDSPLTCDDRYVRIDSDGISAEEVVSRILAEVRRSGGPGY